MLNNDMDQFYAPFCNFAVISTSQYIQKCYFYRAWEATIFLLPFWSIGGLLIPALPSGMQGFRPIPDSDWFSFRILPQNPFRFGV